MDDVTARLEALERRVRLLEGEAQVRRVLGRYMFLCDAPLAEPHLSHEDRAGALGALFTADAVWEGVGAAHGAKFGRHVGPAAIARHLRQFFEARDPEQVFNTHYLCSEQIFAEEDTAEGRWVQFQPWIFDDGTTMLRSSRLQVRFRLTEAGWKISHYRTENLFVADLPPDWAQTRIARSVLFASM